jgi:site-specific DNA-cytosine methylase
LELEQDGVHVKLVHVFACDNTLEVQRWLRRHGEMKYLLNDIQDFARQYVVDKISDQYVHIDKCSIDFVIAGTSCVDISAENTKRAEFAQCVEEGTNSSGGTWHGFLDVLQLLQPRAALTENVAAMFWKFPNVRRTHAEVMQEHVNTFGFVAAPNLIESRETGLAQRRNRAYMPMVAGKVTSTTSMALGT